MEFRSKTELTPRQKEILQMLANGLSEHKIAEELKCSKAVVTTHKINIFIRLMVRDKDLQKAINIGKERGIIV